MAFDAGKILANGENNKKEGKINPGFRITTYYKITGALNFRNERTWQKWKIFSKKFLTNYREIKKY